MKKILVAIDGSKYSQKALFKAKQMATDMGSEVTAFTVVTLYDNVYSQTQSIKSELRKAEMEKSMKILKEAEDIFADFKGSFTSQYKVGDTVDEIIKFAEAGDYDLLIMGSRGLGVFSRALLGSVSEKVIHHVKTSVMLVK